VSAQGSSYPFRYPFGLGLDALKNVEDPDHRYKGGNTITKTGSIDEVTKPVNFVPAYVELHFNPL